MAKVKVGVIGVGVMGNYHAKIYSTLKEANFVGVFDPDIDRANEAASNYNCRSFDKIENLLKEVEAVTIASPTSLHYCVALLCIKNHIHALIEKPMAQTSTEAEEIVSLAKNNKLIYSVGMIERFNPAYKKALSLAKHETILGLDFKRYSPLPSRITDASVVFDMMLHDIDLALTFSRTEVSSLKASGKKVKTEKLDEASATLFFKDGLVAKIEASRIKEEKRRAIIITTDKSIYEVDLLNKQLFKRDFDHLTDKITIELTAEDQLTAELKDFLHAINQKRAPKVPAYDGIKPIKIAEEVERLSC